ncbi:MAG TPA: hypothetical protein VGN02_11950, partial [Paenibacillus sp.]
MTTRNRRYVAIIFLICLALVMSASLIHFTGEKAFSQGIHQKKIYKHIFKSDHHTRHFARANT